MNKTFSYVEFKFPTRFFSKWKTIVRVKIRWNFKINKTYIMFVCIMSFLKIKTVKVHKKHLKLNFNNNFPSWEKHSK